MLSQIFKSIRVVVLMALLGLALPAHAAAAHGEGAAKRTVLQFESTLRDVFGIPDATKYRPKCLWQYVSSPPSLASRISINHIASLPAFF